MRCLGNIVVRQRMQRLSRPWLASVVWSACVLGCSLALLLPSLGRAAEQAELEYAKGIVAYGKGNYPYSDTSRTYAPNTRIYGYIKGRFPSSPVTAKPRFYVGKFGHRTKVTL